MAAINFPSAPTNNQEHSENGVNYRYNSTIGAWLVIAPSLLANTSNHQIIFNYNDATMGSNGLMFQRESNTFIVANVLSRTNVTATYYFGDGSTLNGMAVHIGPPFTQANTARDQANLAFAAANLANNMAVGNTLSGIFTNRTNKNGLNFIPGTQVTAINVDNWSAQDRTNVTINVDVTSPFLQANTARDQANSAFTRANLANQYVVANTTAAGVMTIRSDSRTRLNFIPGAQITVGVVDDSAADRANVTITADVTSPFLQANTARNQANDAYTRANVANQYTVGNTTTAGVFTLRSTSRSRLNFIPGGTLTINVDDDSAGDRANITITASGSSSFTANIGNNSANTFNIAHNLAKQFCHIQVREYEYGGYYVYPDIRAMTPNHCVIQFVSPPTTNQYVVIVVGVA